MTLERAQAANLYSVGDWDEYDQSFVASYGTDLVGFFAAASQAGDAIVMKIDF